MSKALNIAAAAEALTGAALLIVPSLVGQLLLGQELTGAALPVARVTGMALIALGLACSPAGPPFAMFVYSAAVTLYLGYLGIAGGFSGLMLWPATVVHAALTVALGRALLAATES